MSELEVETFEHEGVQIKILQDWDAGDPRESRDSLTRIVWADKTYLALKHDEQIDLDRFWTEKRNWTPVALAARWLTLFDWPANAVAVPFVIEDYGSHGSQAHLIDIDYDKCTGFIVVRKQDLEEELNLAPDWDVMEYIKAEFSEFKAWIEGDVYGYVVADGDDDVDSCWGFYGDIEYVRDRAKESAEHIAKERYVNTEPPDAAEVLAP